MTDRVLIYLVDDDSDLREATIEVFEQEELAAQGFSRASEALKILDPEWPGVIVSDMKMPGLSGLEFLKQAGTQTPDVPFVLMTGHGDVASAIAAMKAGAYDFIEKPVRPEYLIGIVRRALETRRLQLENKTLQARLKSGDSLNARLLGQSSAIRKSRKDILAIAPLSVDVLITGETGTGKGLAARCTHDFSSRSDEAFVAINCGAQTVDDFDAAWFGGDGYVEQAHGGTLFLDELESLDEALQIRLLRYLEDRRADPQSPRVIAALKSNPTGLIEAGVLRADLFHRINVTAIALPRLRERGNDVALLLDFFLRDAAARHDLKQPKILPADLTSFKTYPWPGNVRELRNTAEKLVIGLDVILEETQSELKIGFADYDKTMAHFEKELLKNALVQAGGRKGQAAALLGIPRKRLYLRMKQCGLKD